MIDLLDTQAVDYLRRWTVFGRNEGACQFGIIEFSIMSWTRNWAVVGIDGLGLEVLPFHYPTWLHNLWQAFSAGRPEPRDVSAGKAYEMAEQSPEVRVYDSKAGIMEDIGWAPSVETGVTTFMAISVPAGRQTVLPIAFKFVRPKEREDTCLWMPMPGAQLQKKVKTGTVDVFFQNLGDHVPHARDEFIRGGRYERSQYQACVITRTELCEPMVNPMGDYYRWAVEENERQSQWITA